jgi:hypothetical protein
MAILKGGDKAADVLKRIGDKARGLMLSVGFFEDSPQYDNGQTVATVAFLNEFGSSPTVPEHETTIYRSMGEDGEFNKNGKFVKKSKSNFATTHHVDAYSFTIPPRPFFRNMIAEKSGEWSGQLAASMKNNGNDGKKALEIQGQIIEHELVESINEFTTPGNAPSTIRRKGFNKPLVDTGNMLNSVTSKVTG